MQAIEISEFGDYDVLRLTDRKQPEISDDEVLIKVHAAGVNRPDIVQRQGKYPPPEGVTDIPGLEVAGEIIKSSSSHWKEGDKVCALLAGGGYAEYVSAPAGQCLLIPENLTMNEAAALPETIFTVWNNLFKRAHLKKGQRALVHGGSSGIGTAAILMAKAMGAKIAVTAGSDEKCNACLKLGADKAINYKKQDFVKELGNESVDCVLDMVGGDYIERNIEVLKTDGHHVSIAFLAGIKAQVNIAKIMQKRIIMTGSTLRPRSLEEKQELRDEIKANIWPHVISGSIKPVIHKEFALKDAALAHKELERGDHIGKIILKVV